MRFGNIIRSALGLASLVIVVWAFCNVAGRAIERRKAQHDRPITLSILHWGNPAEDRIDRDLVAGFEKENSHVRIVRINVGDYANFHQKLKTMMASGEPPDAFYLPQDILPTLARLKLIRPLDSFIAHEDKAYLDDFFPILRNGFKFDPASGAFGVGPTWALPKDFTTAVIYCNVDLMNAAGVDYRDIQKNGWTWDRYEAEMKKFKALRDRPEYAGREIYGAFLFANSESFRNIIWTYGGDYFYIDPVAHLPDFRRVTLDTPVAQEALTMIRRMRIEDHTSFNATGIAKDGGQEFMNGNIGCFGPVGRWWVPTYKTLENFHWDVLPVPYKATKASMLYYTGWAMSSACKHPDEAYQLIHYLCGKQGQIDQSRAGLSLPSRMSVAYSDDFLNPPPPEDPTEAAIPKHNAQAFLDAIDVARIQQIPEQTEWRELLETDINRCVQTGQKTPEQMAKDVQRDWLAELDSPTRTAKAREMPWGAIVGTAAVAMFGALVALAALSQRRSAGMIDRSQERAGFAFILPWLVGFLALTLGPMVVSLILSLSRFNGMSPISEASFIGTANFRQLFGFDATFTQSLKVTAYYVILAVPVLQIAALLLALLMNLKLRGITIFRTVIFVPSVISGVAIAVIWLHLFNDSYGPINEILRPVLAPLHVRPPNWFGVDVSVDPPINDAARWAVPGLVIMGLWGVGGGMIIYLAGLKGIPESLYEAAKIDGAGVMRRFWNVTLPMLSPLIFYNVVMGIIASFQIFTQAYVMTGPGPDNATLFYVLNLYRQAFVFHNMGYASAMAWVLFVIVLVLTIVIFRVSRNLVYYEGLKA
jgi:multiple sugar transport system permease protein